MANKQKSLAAAQKHIQKGNYARAISAYEDALEADPEDNRLRLKLGEAHQKHGDLQGAIRVYNDAAEHHEQSGFLLKAAAIYKRILGLDPRNIRVHFQLAEVYHKLGLLSDAMSYYYAVATIQQESGDGRGYLDTLRQMSAMEPSNVGIRIKLAEHLSRLGDLDSAINEFEQATTLLRENGRTEDYIKVAERLIYHKPDALSAIHELVRVYLDRNDTRRALGKLHVAAKHDPRNVQTLDLLAETFEKTNQRENAAQVLREQARILDNTGQRDRATTVWERYLKYAPNDEEARDRLGLSQPKPAAPAPPPKPPEVNVYEEQAQEIERLLTETDVYIRYGLNDKAFEHLRKVFLMDPNNLDAMERIKEMHYQAGYYPQAVDELLRMAKLAYHQDVSRAIGYLREAIQLIPDSQEALDLAASLGLSRDDLFPSAPQNPEFVAEHLPSPDSVDSMLAHLTADLGENGLEGAAPLQEMELLEVEPVEIGDEDLDMEISIDDDVEMISEDEIDEISDEILEELDDAALAQMSSASVHTPSMNPDALLEPDDMIEVVDDDSLEHIDEGSLLDVEDISEDMIELQDGFGLSQHEVASLDDLLGESAAPVSLEPQRLDPNDIPDFGLDDEEEDDEDLFISGIDDEDDSLVFSDPAGDLVAGAQAQQDEDLFLAENDGFDESMLSIQGHGDLEDLSLYGDHEDATPVDFLEETEENPQTSALQPAQGLPLISQETRQSLSQYASHFKHEAATAAYTPASDLGTVTEEDLRSFSAPPEEDRSVQYQTLPSISSPPAPQPSPAPSAEIDENLALELEEVDFFVEQDLIEDAITSLEELLEDYPEHPELLRRIDALRAPIPAPSAPPSRPVLTTPPPAVIAARTPATSAPSRRALTTPSPPAPSRPALTTPPPSEPKPTRAPLTTPPPSTGERAALTTPPPATPEPARTPLTTPPPATPEPAAPQVSASFDAASLPMPNFNGNNSNTHFELALAYKEMGLNEDAGDELRVAVQSQEQAAESFFLLGQLHMEKEEYSEACTALKQALRSCRNEDLSQHILYRLGLSHMSRGESVEASYFFQKLNQQTHPFEDVAARIAALA